MQCLQQLCQLQQQLLVHAWTLSAALLLAETWTALHTAAVSPHTAKYAVPSAQRSVQEKTAAAVYRWLNPIFSKGNKRHLEPEDVYNVLQEDSSLYLGTKLEKEWGVELERRGKEGARPPSLRHALVRTFGAYHMLWIVVGFFEETVRVVQPLLLGGLIRYFSTTGGDTEPWEAYLYAGGVGACAVITALTHHPYFLAAVRVGTWMRIASCALIYKKCLRLSTGALSRTGTGQIVNIVSNDVLRFDQSLVGIHFLLLGPLQALVVLVILWYKIGWGAVAGITFTFLLLPILGVLSRIFARLRSRTAPCTDERVRLMHEVLNAMQLVKLYCWERLFNQLIDTARRREVQRIMTASFARAVTFSTFFYSGKIVVYLSFLTYVLLGNTLSAEIVFVAISLYNVVRFNMTFMVPFGIQFMSEALVSVNRIQAFLLLEEVDLDSVNSLPAPVSDPKVSVIGATASWDETLGSPVLRDLSVEVGRGELLAVIGPVGAGKTSLLMAILGELPLVEGKVGVRGKMAYVSQQAWVFSASVRQNITFGAPFDAAKYNRVIHATALIKDFELMSEGDRTLVGDRGVSLSGGQKARISLARALYSDADVYLLDDPLSAVDMHVSNHIFNKCICGLLKKKPRVLVTHQHQYLKAADRILILSRDERARVGTYEELNRGGVDMEILLQRISESIGAGEPLSHPGSPQRQLSAGGDSLFTQPLSKHIRSTALRKESAGEHDLSESLLSNSWKGKNGYLSEKGGEDVPMEDRHAEEGGLLKAAASMASVYSFGSTAMCDDTAEFVPQAQGEETMVGGSVSPSLYARYFYAGGGALGVVLCVALNLLAQTTYILADWWLAYWCNEIEAFERVRTLDPANATLDSNLTADPVTSPPSQLTTTSEPFPRNDLFLRIFTAITFSVVVFGVLRALHTFHMFVRASDNLHRRMLAAILRCPMAFFENNPIGRILNRFSKDLGQIDETMPLFMYDLLQTIMLVIGVILVVGIANPWVFLPAIPLFGFFVYLRQYFLKTSRNLKRLEATLKSPVFSHISATVHGVQTIRAYRAQTTFVREYDAHQDANTAAHYLYLVTSRWFAVRLELMCALFIVAVALASVLASQNMNGGMVGLSLMYAMTLMMMFQWAVRQSSEVESLMTSVERMVEYSKLPPESCWDTTDKTLQLREWPTKGAIAAVNVDLQYSVDGPRVLNALNFSIEGAEKIGIVGRTGAGKSSLIAMLFRLVEPSGKIIIDNVDILKIGLHDVRKKISIIPQDPVLLNGTVRKNLDPVGLKSDIQVWHALQQVQLRPLVEEMGLGLDSEIHEGGSNISMGQRQLFCLARAILNSNRILIIDEGTANVDPVTDALIQKTIRSQFEHCTVLTIAHRLNTIADSNRVMVLDAGRIIEFDTPLALLQNSNGVFHKMAQQMGPADFELLLLAAKESTASHVNNPERHTEVLPRGDSTSSNGENAARA